MACTEQFIAALRKRGMRMTPQREMVLAALHDLPGHAPADEILRRVQRHSAAVDISTVYRTLDLLHEMGMLAVAEGADGQRHYALTGQHHGHVHLVCKRCGRDVEVDRQAFQALADEVLRRYGFALDLAYHSISGLCAVCACAGSGREGEPSPEGDGDGEAGHRKPAGAE